MEFRKVADLRSSSSTKQKRLAADEPETAKQLPAKNKTRAPSRADKPAPSIGSAALVSSALEQGKLDRAPLLRKKRS